MGVLFGRTKQNSSLTGCEFSGSKIGPVIGSSVGICGDSYSVGIAMGPVRGPLGPVIGSSREAVKSKQIIVPPTLTPEK